MNLTMQVLVGLAIIITMIGPAIKFVLGLKYGIAILIAAVAIWCSCLK